MTNSKYFWLKRLFNFRSTRKVTNSVSNLTNNKKQKFINEYENKESLNWHFCYNDADNYEFPLIRKSNGERIGYSHQKGARVFSKDRQTYSIARLVWIYFNGDVPEGKRVLHKNKNKLDNRIDNLYVKGYS